MPIVPSMPLLLVCADVGVKLYERVCVFFFYLLKFYEPMTKRCKRACASASYNVRSLINSEKKCDELGTVLFFFTSRCRPTAPLAAISRLFNAVRPKWNGTAFLVYIAWQHLKLYRNTTQQMNELNQFRIRWHTTFIFVFFFFLFWIEFIHPCA